MKKLSISVLLILTTAFWLQAQELGLKESKEFFNLEALVGEAQFSPFRNYFALTLGNNVIRIYDRDWEKVYEYQCNPEAGAGALAFSPDEMYLAYGRYKAFNDIAIIRLEDMKVMQVLSRHNDKVRHLEFSHDGKFLVSTSSDKHVIIWKLKEEMFQFSQIIDGFEGYIDQSSFSHNDRFLVICDFAGHMLVLERKGERYEEFQEKQYRNHRVGKAVFHPRKDEFIFGSVNGVRRFRLQNGAFVLTDSVRGYPSVHFPAHFSPDGHYLTVPHFSTLMIYSVSQDSIYLVDNVYRHMQTVFGGTFSDDGKFLTTYSSDPRLIIWEIDHVQPSDKSVVVSWLNRDLSQAQGRSLIPATIRKIKDAVDDRLILPRDEFETSVEYYARMGELADWTLMMLQQEMEKQYDVRVRSGTVEIPVQSLVGYNADLQIYKIKFMETEAGVAMPIPAAKKFKQQWERSHIRATRERVPGGLSYRYSSFELLNPADKQYYEVTPLENPFYKEEEQAVVRTEITGEDEEKRDSLPGLGKTYALMFASNVYDFYSDLVNPVLDAQTIAMELAESYGVESEVVLNPTLAETAAMIREYASRSYEPEDNLLVFFAGHGVYDEVFREGYVISRDSRMDDLGKTSYLSHSNLRTMINNIDCPHIFLVMDVCFGGTFDPHLASTHRGTPSAYADISTQEFVERKLKYKTRLYLTSGGKEYVPDGRPGFHSPFARRFIESLRYYGGDDGVLTTAEILQFVEKVNPQPRFGEFGDNEPGSDFILVVR